MLCHFRRLSFVFGLAVVVAGFSTAAAEPLTFSLQRLQAEKAVTVTEKDFDNKYLLMAVGYTGCPDICPTTLLDIRVAMQTLDNTPAQAAKVQPLFITIDPEADTLTDISQYTAFFDPRIIGLRAIDYATLDNVVEQLRASYGYLIDGKPVLPPNLPKGYTVMHSTFIYLYSPDRQLLDAYPYNMDGKTLANNILSHIKS